MNGKATYLTVWIPVADRNSGQDGRGVCWMGTVVALRGYKPRKVQKRREFRHTAQHGNRDQKQRSIGLLMRRRRKGAGGPTEGRVRGAGSLRRGRGSGLRGWHSVTYICTKATTRGLRFRTNKINCRDIKRLNQKKSLQMWN